MATVGVLLAPWAEVSSVVTVCCSTTLHRIGLSIQAISRSWTFNLMDRYKAEITVSNGCPATEKPVHITTLGFNEPLVLRDTISPIAPLNSEFTVMWHFYVKCQSWTTQEQLFLIIHRLFSLLIFRGTSLSSPASHYSHEWWWFCTFCFLAEGLGLCWSPAILPRVAVSSGCGIKGLHRPMDSQRILGCDGDIVL